MAPCYYVALLYGLIELLKGHSKFVSEAYPSNLFLDEDKMLHDLQPTDYVYWKASFKGLSPS